MAVYLLAKLIGEDTVGVDIEGWSSADLNGDPPFKFSDSVESGYTDITTIQYLSQYGHMLKDYKYVRRRILDVYYSIGWDNLSFDEQKIICKYMASGIGAEYNNGETIWTNAEQYEFQIEFREHMQESRKLRDEAVSNYMMMMVFTGQALLQSMLEFISSIFQLREMYFRDGIEGTQWGDGVVGYFDYIMNYDIYSPLSVIANDNIAYTVTVDGDVRDKIIVGSIFMIRCDEFDTQYTVIQCDLSDDDTVITVEEEIPEVITNGSIYYIGFLSRPCADINKRNDIMKIYIDGDY